MENQLVCKSFLSFASTLKTEPLNRHGVLRDDPPDILHPVPLFSVLSFALIPLV
jgi:hypothetical protein